MDPKRLVASLVGGIFILGLAALACQGTASSERDTAQDGGADVGSATRMDGRSPSTDAADARTEAAPTSLADASFLTDPSIWTHVDAAGGVPLFTAARLSPDPFPRRLWTSCGPGCQVASSEIPVAGGREVESTVSGATYLDGDIVLSAVSGVVGVPGSDPTIFVAQTIRLSDGATVAAHELRGPKAGVFAVLGDDSPFVVSVFASAKGMLFGKTDPASWMTQWRSDWVSSQAQDTELTKFSIGQTVGVSRYSGSIELFPLAPNAVSTVIDGSPAAAYVSSARGDLLVWSKWNGTDRDEVRAYTQARGLKPLFSRFGLRIRGVNVTDDRIVWTGTTGTDSADGSVAKGQFFWSPRATRAEDIQLTEGPTFSMADGVLELVSGGDYAATVGCRKEGTTDESWRCELYVIRMSTKQMWILPSRSGSTYEKIFAISDKEILLADMDWPYKNANYPTVVQRFMRIELASLDALKAAWGK